jgi:excisionase family DNA binding protein
MVPPRTLESSSVIGDDKMSHTVAPPKIAYSVKEACAATSLGRTTLFEHIKNGRLVARKIGGRTVIPAESLRALIAGEA